MTPTAVATVPSRSLALHVSLWVLQIALAAMFLMAAVTKTTQPIAQMSQMINWADEIPEWLVRFIGISEGLGALGLILPALTRVKPWLTPLAAAGLAVVMLLAIGFHIMRGEFNLLLIPALLGGVAAFIAWGRYAKAPIAPPESPGLVD